LSEGVRGLLLGGVGGQGVILASMIVAETLLAAGHDVKQSEVHGMAQRGGSVFSHIRFGQAVSSPLVALGSAEVLAAFEWAEALRWLPYLSGGGALVADIRRIVPPGACDDRRTWASRYPIIDVAPLEDRDVKTRLIDASGVAAGLGNAKAANSVVLGAVAAFLDVPTVHWEDTIERLVPTGTAEVNLAAFHAGMEAPPATLQAATPSNGDAPPQANVDINTTWCKGCDICSRVCPEYCLAVDGDGAVAVVRPDACTGCRLCELLCPDFAISVARASATAGAAARVGDLG